MTIVAMLGVVGVVLADTGNNNGTKVLPIAKDVPAQKAMKALTEDSDAAVAPATNSAHPANSPFAVPSNDDCTGAIVIPSGSLPYVTAAVDITDATPQGSDDPDVCPANTVDQTIWYTFTPVVSGQYVFSTCNGFGATGSTIYDSVIGIFDACSGGTTLKCDDSSACAPALPGAPYTDQGTAAAVLSAGTTYYIAAGHWSGDVGGVGPGFDSIAIMVSLSPAPANDTCSAPTPLALGRITFGTTASATNDYRSPTACFTGIGQIPTTANGLDVVFSFVPPATGSYSFRYVQDDASAALRGQSPALYLADNCPAPDASTAITGCIKGANRMNDQTNNGNRSEEINCVTLTSGTPYYLFFDDRFTANPGGPLAVEVTNCVTETEPNGTPGTANAYPGCFTTGSSNPATDVDFFDLGMPVAGSKIFTAVDAVASNNSNYEMRITNSTDTLGYDDNDGSSWIGSNAPIVTGVIADGSEIFVRVNNKSTTVANEPYHLYAKVYPPGTVESEINPGADGVSNGTFYGATHLTGNGFVGGIMSSQTDQDCFRFIAHTGDNLLAFSDNNPSRGAGTITNVWPVLQTLVGGTPANTRFVGQVVRNLVTPSPGTLTGVTPSVTSEFSDYRARYTGTHMYCYTPTQDATTENPPASAYPLPYQGSISANCATIPVEPPSDVKITKTGPTGAVKTGTAFDYTITLTNMGGGVAQDIQIKDFLPPQLLFLGLTVNDGFTGRNVGCINLPDPGASTPELDCTNYSLAPGESTTFTLTVQVANCIGAGIDIVNTAAITRSFSTDTDLTNNSESWTVTTSEDGSCADLLCDAGGCILNGCTGGIGVEDHCVAGVCVTTPRDCDDHSLCTDDSCDPVPTDGTNCINDSRLLGDLCNDGNACTGDGCDPLLFCVFPNLPEGTACDDFLNCTNNDQCCNGSCAGHSVCDDGQPCTDDFGDESNNCQCFNDISFPGTVCSDGDACTVGEVCDGLGGTVADCNGSTAANCDDGNPCTDDFCNPGAGGTACSPTTGCGHTNNTAPCDDNTVCNGREVCGGGTCHSGTALNCDDGQCCTIDSCDPAAGCQYAPNPARPAFVNQPSLGACAVLWPPQHGYVDFTVANTGATAASQCGIASIQFASCNSSQPDNGTGVGDGNSTRDCVYASDLLSMRAERDGACSPTGRVYTASVVATDVCGNTVTSSGFDVGVWHDRGHPPNNTYYSANPGSNQNDTRVGPPGTSGPGCGDGSACVNGTSHDSSDADPEMEISQNASITVNDLRLEKASGGNVKLTWDSPVPNGQITRYHIYRLDPVTLFWTQIAEVDRQVKSYLDPVLNDAFGHQYKITGVIK